MRIVPLAPELDRSSACRALAKITGGFSGAELANVVNEAALLAGRKEAEVGPWSVLDQWSSCRAPLSVLQQQRTTLFTHCWTVEPGNKPSQTPKWIRSCMQSITCRRPGGCYDSS